MAINKEPVNKEALRIKTQALLEYPKIMENVAGMSVSEEAALIIKNSSPIYDNSIEKNKIFSNCHLYDTQNTQ